MIPEALDDLYKLLRGSRSANMVLDARAVFQDDKFTAAHEKLIEAREAFMETRSRLMRQDADAEFTGKSKEDDRNRKKLVRKQEKTQQTIKAFDDLMPKLERLAKRETPPPQADPVVLAKPSDVTESMAQAYRQATPDQRLSLVNAEFGFREVRGDADLYPHAVYLIVMGEQSHLVATPLTTDLGSQIEVKDLVQGRPIKPFSREAFLKLGTDRKMVLLTKSLVGSNSTNSGTNETTAQTEHGDGLDDEADGPVLLDTAAFSQLLTAAGRSGLVSGADQIGHVRDREFRLGHYDLAFQSINALFSQFTSAAGSRTQQLSREDAEISAGRIKISPKDLQAKRARDRMQTQEIERARRRFQVVLEGLRQLLASQSDDP